MTDHWSKKHKRKKDQQFIIRAYLKTSKFHLLKLPVTITLTRLAPRTLDCDNLLGACKWARDTIADYFIPGLQPGRADDSDDLTFVYKQEKSKEYALLLEITK